jgi:hypothetical protein
MDPSWACHSCNRNPRISGQALLQISPRRQIQHISPHVFFPIFCPSNIPVRLLSQAQTTKKSITVSKLENSTHPYQLLQLYLPITVVFREKILTSAGQICILGGLETQNNQPHMPSQVKMTQQSVEPTKSESEKTGSAEGPKKQRYKTSTACSACRERRIRVSALSVFQP